MKCSTPTRTAKPQQAQRECAADQKNALIQQRIGTMMHPLGGQVLSVRAIASNVFGGTGEDKLVGV